jgi:selenocysteine-specific elongation factor
LDPAETRLVLGTAGHIDHGKTALIRALTGVDTDRLPEEKARGITIELGFAPLELGNGLRLGVVDVPGHEGLVRTMVAGATGIDLVLLVVAADEGVMPQTREHVAICELLGIDRGVVALTKIDAAGEELAELAEADIADHLAETSLANAPIVRVSALTGVGIEELRKQLEVVGLDAPARTPRSGPPRLPIDRCFAARGFGTVVTGTLVGAPFEVGEGIEVQPSGRRARVRGIQNHGAATERAEPGSRCALNLQGIEVMELSRGQVVTRPDALVPAARLDATLSWLGAAPEARGPAAVEFLTGTAERRAHVAPIGADRIVPGACGFARIHIEGEPVPVLPGDRFILRGFSRTALGGSTLGGGVVLDVAPPRRRRSDPQLLRDLEQLEAGDHAAALHVRIRREGLAGIARERLRRESGLDADALERALAALRESGRTVVTTGGSWLDATRLEELERRLLQALDTWHAAEPIQPGIPGAALRGALPENVPRDAAELALAGLVERGVVCVEEELVRRAEHRPTLAAEDAERLERLVDQARNAGLEPPGFRDLCEQHGVEPDRLRDLLAHAERAGRLVRAPGDLWFDREIIDALRRRVVEALQQHERLDTKAYKALIGTSRRSAVPLMELFDAERVTVRRGDHRLLRKPRETS